jgi:hypothetical protein
VCAHPLTRLQASSSTLSEHSSQRRATSTLLSPPFHGRALVDAFNGPSVTTDAVVGRDGFLAGLDVSVDAQGRPKSYSAAFGYSAPEYSVTLKALAALSAFQASYYHRVNRDVEAGAIATYKTSTPGAVDLQVGAKTYLDAAAFISACTPSYPSRRQCPCIFSLTLPVLTHCRGQGQQQRSRHSRIHPGSPTRCQSFIWSRSRHHQAQPEEPVREARHSCRGCQGRCFIHLRGLKGQSSRGVNRDALRCWIAYTAIISQFNLLFPFGY